MRDFFSEKADIIIVDDEPLNRKIASRMLTGRFNIREAGSGEEALQLVKEKKPDLILLDVHMPGMNGHDVINSLKAVDETFDIPVVFVTADDDRETEANGLMEGADDFITKPFRQDILIQRISRIIELHFLQSNLKEEVARQTAKAEERSRKIEQMSLQTIHTLANAIDAKDPYTKGHSARVSQYSVMMAEALGWDKDKVENLRYAALLHDIGKIGVPDSILNNPKKLSDAEYSIIKGHANMGGDILKNRMMVEGAEDVARSHHERFDGSGYPRGLEGENISEQARIVSIADAFDAMSSKRIYRRAYSFDFIRNELIEGKGKQFDPYLVDIFIGLWDHGLLDVILKNDSVEEDDGMEASSALLQEVMESFVAQNGVDDIDITTGIMSRTTGEAAIAQVMQEENGCFIFFDVDNLKKINDTNGHKAGDRVLKLMGDTLIANSENSLCCRLGGDEFLFFMKNVSKDEAEQKVQKIINEFVEKKNEDAEIAVASLSAGLIMSTPADTYAETYNKADKALYHVKQNGKDGYSFYNSDSESARNEKVDINRLVNGIKNSGSYEGAMDVEYRQFAKLFEYIANLEKRYAHPFKLVMITLEASDEESPRMDELEDAMFCMEQSIRQTVRNVDIVTRYSRQQFLVILLVPDIEGVNLVVERIFRGYYKMNRSGAFTPTYSIADMDSNKEKDNENRNGV
ncbi:MAG: diguanylate cyclase [Lachnospiraceae bacterium]|nr:diguanylate cyclase [Lachnospiraceae bacterium]